MQASRSQNKVERETSPSFCAGRKLREIEQQMLWSLLEKEPKCQSRILLLRMAEKQVEIKVSLRQVNRWRAAFGVNRGKGRPEAVDGKAAWPGSEKIVRSSPHVSFVGVHLFARWLEQGNVFEQPVEQIEKAVEAHIKAHPEDGFPLLRHRKSTILGRFQALLFAPLLGIKRVIDFDTHEHPLETLIGSSYQSSTLSQFMGQLERVNAAEFLRPVLLLNPVEPVKSEPISDAKHLKNHRESIGYIDGHMIAYWSRRSMHKGKVTMLGRIMAGSQAVIAHEKSGQAVFVEYYAPDIHLSQFIVDYCQKVAKATGVTVFVIDRAANSVALARAFEEQGLGLICMLNDNEYQGQSSFEAIEVDKSEDGSIVYSGSWKEPRENDPRQFVLVQPLEGKSLVYWATPKVKESLEASQWPRVYRARNEIQELRFKGMIEHGALNINYGRKTITGLDRHHQRREEELERTLEAARVRMDKKSLVLAAQREKVMESESKGHSKRLLQRESRIAAMEQELQDATARQTKCSEQVSALGPTGQRADRDFRKQTIMTIRTLFLENLLMAFMAVLLGTLSIKVSLQQVLGLLFERSGSRTETSSEIFYQLNTSGLSLANHRLLGKIVRGLATMGLKEGGKPLHISLSTLPP